ncbi:hypothetical protein [Sphingobium fuliginis]|uniref:hypothetical protein n=1 Tax=Sphingobium fuliginis (strain ATCC 27551) TaxID=336203 RepID=UPI001ABF3125|nr:hypothetical protein [Sphingobium fuliginis]
MRRIPVIGEANVQKMGAKRQLGDGSRLMQRHANVSRKETRLDRGEGDFRAIIAVAAERTACLGPNKGGRLVLITPVKRCQRLRPGRGDCRCGDRRDGQDVQQFAPGSDDFRIARWEVA